jgi:hypothetical protein
MMFGGTGNTRSEHRLMSGHRVFEGTHTMPGGGTLHAWRYGNGLTGVVEHPMKPGYSSRTYVQGGRVLYARVYHQNTFQRYGHSYSYSRLVPAIGFGVAYYAWAARPWSAPVAYQWQWDSQPWHRAYGNDFTPYSNYSSLDEWLTDYVVAENLRNAYESQQAEYGPGDQPVGQQTARAGSGGSYTGPRPYWDTPDDGRKPDWDVPDNRKPYWEEQSGDADSVDQPNGTAQPNAGGAQSKAGAHPTRAATFKGDGQSGGAAQSSGAGQSNAAGQPNGADQPNGGRQSNGGGQSSGGSQSNGPTQSKGAAASKGSTSKAPASGESSGSQGQPSADDAPPPLSKQVKAELNAQIKRQLAERQTPAADGATDLPDSLKPGHTLFRVSAPLDVASKNAGQLCSLRANDYIERTGDMDQDGMVPVKVKVGGASDCTIGLLTKVSVNDLEAMESEQQQALTDALLAASKNMGGAKGLPQGPGTTPMLLAAGQTHPSPDATTTLGQLQ